MAVKTAPKYNKYQIYNIIKNYYWMIREIERIDRELEETEFKGTAQYGIEATLPKAKGIVGKALENEAIRRVNKSKRLNRYIDQIIFINERMKRITDEKEKVVLDCLLDGMTISGIANHLKMSRTTITEIRDNIVDKLAE